jgi:hypothetical protein
MRIADTVLPTLSRLVGALFSSEHDLSHNEATPDVHDRCAGKGDRVHGHINI